jgi:hypothetical protein
MTIPNCDITVTANSAGPDDAYGDPTDDSTVAATAPAVWADTTVRLAAGSWQTKQVAQITVAGPIADLAGVGVGSRVTNAVTGQVGVVTAVRRQSTVLGRVAVLTADVI